MDAAIKAKLMSIAQNPEPFDFHNHVRIVDVDDGVGVVELDVHPESLNIWGTTHGGLLYSLSDVACGCAVLTVRPESHVTVTGSMDYLRPAPATGRVIATGRVTKMGGKLAYCDSEIRDGAGTLIATGRAVMCFTGKPML
ncbi:MAG: PaaI family thioesterase [Oscillospiraceae bacterium]|nr:PaaI family thioesterase [Oscillospiraceae bacterium]